MKFLVDVQLPPALARLPGELGPEAVAVRDVNLRAGIQGTGLCSKNAAASCAKTRNSPVFGRKEPLPNGSTPNETKSFDR